MVNLHDSSELEIQKYEQYLDNEDNHLQKGGRSLPIGTRKTFGGREYIKTVDGWKFVGKGRGTAAQQHVAAYKQNAATETGGKTQGQQVSELQEGHSVTAADGTKGTITSRKEGNVTVKTESGKEHTMPESYLNRQIQSGKVQHSNREEPIDTHKERGFNPSKGDTDVASQSESVSQEERSMAETGLPNSTSTQQSHTLAEQGGADRLNEQREGFSVRNDAVLTRAGDVEEEDDEADINHKFEAFGRFAAGVIKGRMKSLIAYGSGGVGKTYTVTKELEKAGKKIFDPEEHQPGDDEYDYVKLTGKLTAAAVYQAMYEHNGKMLLFDDCDSVLQDENAINLFKGALDTSGDGSVDWGSARPLKDKEGGKIPGKIKFTGRAMFISNLDINKEPNLQPIVSRGYGINLAMDKAQTIQRIKHIATGKDGQMTNLKFPGVPDYSHEDMEAVMNYMNKHRESAADLNVRTVGTLLAIKKDADAAGVNWEKDARYIYLRKSNEIDIFNGGLAQSMKNRILSTYGTNDDVIIEKVRAFTKSLKDKIVSKEHVD